MGRSEKLVIAGLVLLLFAPLLLEILNLPTGYWIRVLTLILMLTSLVYAQNVILGYTGYPAFGIVAFFGVGGYTTAVLMKKFSFPFLASLPLGALFSTLLAFLLAAPLMRLKSHYFAITTLALQLVLGEMVGNLEITGGSYGINLPIYKGPLGTLVFYYAFWLLVLSSFLLNLYIDRSVFGYALKAIREDEVAAESVGVNTLLFKSISFSLMALISGLSGGIYAYWITYIDPPSMFDPVLSVKVFVALLLGGVGTVAGPFFGSLFLEMFSEMVWSKFFELHGVVLGTVIVLTVLLLPKGILGVKR